MAKIKKTQDIRCWVGCRATGTHTLVGCELPWLYLLVSTVGYIPDRNVYICSPNDMYKSVFSSTIYYNQTLEMTEIPISKRMDR